MQSPQLLVVHADLLPLQQQLQPVPRGWVGCEYRPAGAPESCGR
jgi:hypothetical protein